ncbi:unnamed protein product [Thelazia callipaeda]|uniref:Spindle assembly checkpoint component MAD1 n=1 Tax=Thelazia callipaeda TaxID=103827 RepID=A0A0N5D8K2_THECL|nr:unnamed protein product [Thelazia callipaeda]
MFYYSVRQLSIRVRIAEEKVKKYELQSDNLKFTIAQMSKEMDDKQSEMNEMQKAFKEQISNLQDMLSKKKFEDKKDKFDKVISLLQSASETSKIYEPSFMFFDEWKAETANAETQTDDWMKRFIRRAQSTGPLCTAKAAEFSIPKPVINDNREEAWRLSEEIKKLEMEKYLLTTKLKLASNKLEEFKLQEAQKKSLETRLLILSEMNDCLVRENEELKITGGLKSSAENSGIISETQKTCDQISGDQMNGEPSFKIFHMKMNPLEEAHQELLSSDRKREWKESESSSLQNESSSDLDGTVKKKQRTDLMKQIADLEFQLNKAQKENEKALKLQSDLVKKYRAFVTALSGLQIKMKEDDMVEVESIFDPGNCFTFKIYDYGKTISLLETEYATRWTSQIREYLEGRNSTPAFLASVTLILDERAESTTTVSFYPSD